MPANLLGMSGDERKGGIRNEGNLGVHDTDEFNVWVAGPGLIRQTLDYGSAGRDRIASGEYSHTVLKCNDVCGMRRLLLLRRSCRPAHYPSLAVLKIPDQGFHLVDLPPLALDDPVSEPSDARVRDVRAFARQDRD